MAAFRSTNFAQAIVLHKLEVVFTALIGALVFSELPTLTGWLGILLCVAGVVFMQLALVADWRKVFHLDRGSLLAILAGLMLVLASFLLKDANRVLAEMNPRVGAGRFEVAAHTLFNVTWMEVAILTVWLYVRTPAELPLVKLHWRRMLLIGLTGFIGSLGWFLGVFVNPRGLRQSGRTDRSGRSGTVRLVHLQRARSDAAASGDGARGPRDRPGAVGLSPVEVA